MLRGANKTVRKNVVSGNGLGIATSDGSIVFGNVIGGNGDGILLHTGAMTIAGNALMSISDLIAGAGNDERRAAVSES